MRRFSGLSGYRKLIASGVEAVALETPPCFFPEHAQAAVDAGLHVYMAKPVAVDVPGCQSIAASGARALHVVDLDGARSGKAVHAELVGEGIRITSVDQLSAEQRESTREHYRKNIFPLITGSEWYRTRDWWSMR